MSRVRRVIVSCCRLTTALGLAAVLAMVQAGEGRAASVVRVNEAKNRVILKLTKPEMDAVTEGLEVSVEVAGTLLVHGKLTNIKPDKGTVVLVMVEPVEGLEPRQPARILSAYRDATLSAQITSPIQHHQYDLPSVSAGGGILYNTGSMTEESDLEGTAVDKTTVKRVGSVIEFDGHLPLYPDFFGMGLLIRRTSVKTTVISVEEQPEGSGKEDDEDESELSQAITRFAPGLWLAPSGGWILGLRFDQNLGESRFADETYNWELAQPFYSIGWRNNTHEVGLNYLSAAKYETSIAVMGASGTKTNQTFTVRTPAIGWLFWRMALSPVSVFGLGMGIVFYERYERGDELTRKPAAEELAKLRISYETRLNSGSKLDFALYYDGAKVPEVLITDDFGEIQGNRGGLHFGYLRPFASGFLWGLGVSGEGGVLKFEEEEDPPASAPPGTDPVIHTTVTSTYGAQILLLLQHEFSIDIRGGDRW